MTRKWIVGIDGSDAARTALAWAAATAEVHGDIELTAVGVWHVPPPMAMFTAKRGFGVDELGLEATAGYEVDQAIAAVGASIDIAATTRQGVVGHALVEAANEAADVLVVGRTGGGELHERLGSVSRYCATHAAVPVIVVPDDVRDGDGSIVIGFDGSENARAAIRWAMNFAGPTTRVRAVSSVELAPWAEIDVVHERYGDAIAERRDELDADLDELDPATRVERAVVVDAPRRALVDASRTASLVVVGARGHGLIAAGLLGSVSTAILEDTECPVAVVPHADE
ncbi:MAG: universal stress protein [Actinomycetota bacterium]